MSMAPYPPPPPPTGPLGNPGRLPAPAQAIGFLAGVLLVVLIGIAALSGDSSMLVFSLVTGCAGLVLGFTGRSFARDPSDPR